MKPYPKPTFDKPFVKPFVKRPRRKKKTARQLLDIECMELIKNIVRLRYGGCVTPGASCGGYLTASHWQKRGKQWTRFDLRNLACQCQRCNNRHNYYTGPLDTWMLKNRGYDVCLELAERASVNSYKWTIIELRDIRDGLRGELERLEVMQSQQDKHDYDNPEDQADPATV